MLFKVFLIVLWLQLIFYLTSLTTERMAVPPLAPPGGLEIAECVFFGLCVVCHPQNSEICRPKFGHLPPPNSYICQPQNRTFARPTIATPNFLLAHFFSGFFDFQVSLASTKASSWCCRRPRRRWRTSEITMEMVDMKRIKLMGF